LVSPTYNSPQLEQIIAYTRFLVLHDISCKTVKVRPFLKLYKVNTEGDFLRGRKETLLINILKPTLNDK
jgi:hypothetical protein